jgi:hypothetical protein
MKSTKGNTFHKFLFTVIRYHWMKKKLKDYEVRFAQIFPDYWCVPQELIIEFCLATREDVSEILKTSR